MMAVLIWFANTRAGRWCVSTLAIVAAIAALCWKAYLGGKKEQRAQQDAASLRNLREREKTDEEVKSIPDAERRRRLRQWVSNDKR